MTGLSLMRAAAALLALCASVHASDDINDEEVMEWIEVQGAQEEFTPIAQLTDDTLEAFVKENPTVLLEFYAPWCGMCKMVSPEYVRAGWIAHNSSLPFKVAQINADKYTKLADALHVNMYPTIFLYRNGEPETFPVLSVAESYIAGVSRMLDLPGAEEISPVKVWSPGVEVVDVAGWLFWRGATTGAIATTVVFYYPPNLQGAAATSAERLWRTFDCTAKTMFRDPNIRFTIIRDMDVLEAFEVSTTGPSIVMYKEHDEGRVEYEVPRDSAVEVTPADLEAWARMHMVPLVTHITHKNLQAYRQKVRHLGLWFMDAPQVEHRTTHYRIQSDLLQVAQALISSGQVKRGAFTIGLVDGKKYDQWLEHYSLPTGRYPAFGFEDTKTETLYAMGDISVSASCDPPPTAAAAPPPGPKGSPEYKEWYDALPDGFDLVAPFAEADGRPMHTASWCPDGGSFKASREAAARAANASALAAAAAATASVDASTGAAVPLKRSDDPKATPLPAGYIPTFEEGFSHNEGAVARKLINDRREAQGLPPLGEHEEELITGGFSDELFPPLFWTEVPVLPVTEWLQEVLAGFAKPVRKASTATAAAGGQGGVATYADMAARAAGKAAGSVGGAFLETSRSGRENKSKSSIMAYNAASSGSYPGGPGAPRGMYAGVQGLGGAAGAGTGLSDRQVATLGLLAAVLTVSGGVLYVKQAGGRVLGVVRAIRVSVGAVHGVGQQGSMRQQRESMAGGNGGVHTIISALREAAQWQSSSAEKLTLLGSVSGTVACGYLAATRLSSPMGPTTDKGLLWVGLPGLSAGLFLGATVASMFRPRVPGALLLDSLVHSLDRAPAGSAASLAATSAQQLFKGKAAALPYLVQVLGPRLLKALPGETQGKLRSLAHQAREMAVVASHGGGPTPSTATAAGQATGQASHASASLPAEAAGQAREVVHQMSMLAESAWMAGPGLLAAAGCGLASACLLIPTLIGVN